MNALRVFRYGLLVSWREFGIFWNPYTWAGGWMVRILAQVAFFSLLGELIGSPDRLQFLLIGNAVVAGCVTVNIAVPVSTWDRGDGTYPLLVVAPSGLLPPIMGRTSIYLANGVLTSVLALLLADALLRLSLPWPQTLLVVPLVLLSCASTYAMALFLGALATKAPRVRNIVHNIATTSLMAFAGVSVPVAFWPGWVELLANGLPVTHGLHAIRLVLDNGAALDVLEGAALEILVCAGWFGATTLLIDRMADRGRKDGSIEFV